MRQTWNKLTSSVVESDERNFAESRIDRWGLAELSLEQSTRTYVIRHASRCGQQQKARRVGNGPGTTNERDAHSERRT